MAAEFAARRLDRRAPGRRGAAPLAGSLARLRAWGEGRVCGPPMQDSPSIIGRIRLSTLWLIQADREWSELTMKVLCQSGGCNFRCRNNCKHCGRYVSKALMPREFNSTGASLAWQKGLGYQFENANPVSNLCKYNLGCALFQEVLRDGKHEYSNKMR